MAITMTPVRDGVSEWLGPVVRQMLSTPNQPDGAKTTADDRAGGELDLAAPHPVYSVGMTHATDGRLLASARLEGFRFLVLAGDESIATVTVEPQLDDGELRISHLTTGPYVDATVHGIAIAEALPQARENDFQLRLLDVPPLRLRALWLHGDGRDLLVPLAPAPTPLVPYRAYSEDELVPKVRTLVENHRIRNRESVNG